MASHRSGRSEGASSPEIVTRWTHIMIRTEAVTGWGPHLLLRALRQHSGRGQAVGKAWHGHGHFRR
eukprot:COSAG01_NODE_18721_length_1057_cov_64.937370_2_plen_65_part_01